MNEKEVIKRAYTLGLRDGYLGSIKKAANPAGKDFNEVVNNVLKTFTDQDKFKGLEKDPREFARQLRQHLVREGMSAVPESLRPGEQLTQDQFNKIFAQALGGILQQEYRKKELPVGILANLPRSIWATLESPKYIRDTYVDLFKNIFRKKPSAKTIPIEEVRKILRNPAATDEERKRAVKVLKYLVEASKRPVGILANLPRSIWATLESPKNIRDAYVQLIKALFSRKAPAAAPKMQSPGSFDVNDLVT